MLEPLGMRCFKLKTFQYQSILELQHAIYIYIYIYK